MLTNILKKDLKHKKTMNLILLVFIILSTVFLASSVSNLVATMGALDYFAEQSRLSDYFIFALDDELTSWLEDHENVTRFESDQLFTDVDSGFRVFIDESEEELEFAAMLRLPQEFNIPLNFYNQPLDPIENGEIAITFGQARRYDISLGDMLYFEIEESIYAFEVSQFAKEISIFPRMFISNDDFAQITEDMNFYLYMYAIETNDLDSFTTSLNQAMFENLGSRVTADMFMNMFMIDLIVMAVLVMVGICLVAISFVVLRFAIVFTLQEDYKEIGIMKAIGLKNKDIQSIYLVKYLFLACLGGGLGFFLSVPFGDLLMGEIRENIAFPDANSMIFVRLFSSLLIILLILLFCYMSTKKLNKFTAMQAIRSGETGERFKRKSLIWLHRMKKAPAVIYLAINDILSQVKSYLVLFVIFTLGFLLVIVPLNISNTLIPEILVELVQMSVTDVYFEVGDFLDQIELEITDSIEDLRNELGSMEYYYYEHGVELNLQATIMLGGVFYTDSMYEGVIVNAINQVIGNNIEDTFDVLSGITPILYNEIALTETIIDQLNINIGDTVNLALDGESYEFLVTGSYQSLINMGVTARLSSQAILHDGARFGIFTVQGDFLERNNIVEQIQQLEEANTDIKLITLNCFLERILVDFSIIDIVVSLILVVVLVVNVMIVALMGISFMIRDLKQIALIKNLGFSNQAIRLWQGLRILFVMLMSIVLGMLLVPAANILARIPFGIVGAPEITLLVDFKQVYVLYPIIFIVVTCLTLAITTLRIKKVGLHDMGSTD